LDKKAGFVAIVGRPNVGKSTLMNRIIGEKLSIVSPKPQTTRQSVRTFYNSEQGQIIFSDTPGFLEARYSLHEKMLAYIEQSIKATDVVLFITDVSEGLTDYELQLIEKVKRSHKPVIALINKVDLVEAQAIQAKELVLQGHFTKVYAISALTDADFTKLIDVLLESLPAGLPLYSEEDLSDMPMRFFAQEIIREKIFLLFEQEIPYCSTVTVEKWDEQAECDVIEANIWIERESQKPIIIGKNGKMIARIRTEAEQDIGKLTGRRVVLHLWVKVKHDWRKKMGALREFGYN